MTTFHGQGSQVYNSHLKDARRDAKLSSKGFRVLRFWNDEIDHNLSGVLESIDIALAQNAPHPAACGGHPPPSGEG